MSLTFSLEAGDVQALQGTTQGTCVCLLPVMSDGTNSHYSRDEGLSTHKVNAFPPLGTGCKMFMDFQGNPKQCQTLAH